jgi:tetratricopeptide (TPR) repeat protein
VGRSDDEPNRLAYHHAQAGNNLQAIEYYKTAADSAVRLLAKMEANMLYSSAIELAEKTEVSPELIVDLYTGLGRVQEISGNYQGALRNYEKLEEIGRERSDDGIRLGALLPQATTYSTLSSELDPTKGREISEQTIALAQELGDHRAEAKAYWNMMLLEAYSGTDVSIAVAHGERSVEIAREHHLKEELAYSLNDLVRPLLAMGRKDESLASLDEAVLLLRELDDRLMLADSLAKDCDIRTALGDFEHATESAEEALEVSRKNRNRFGEAVAFVRLSVLYGEFGQPEKAIEALTTGRGAARGSGFAATRLYPVRLGLAMADAGDYTGIELAMESVRETVELPLLQRFSVGGVAKIKRLSGDSDGAANSLDEALALAEMEISHPISGFGLSHLTELEVLHGIGRTDAVIETANRYLTSLDSTNVIFRRYDVLRFKGEALEAKGDTSAARKCLEEAVANASEVGSRRGHWQALAALAGFLARNGESGDDEASRAQSILNDIAEEISDEELRTLFVQHSGRSLLPSG